MPNSKLQTWLSRINQQELPIFKYSLDAIKTITASDDSSNNELANAVLKDANLTARLLRLANSFYYNPAGVRISTITNAIMLLGFNVVRDICLSLAIIDVLVKGNTHEYILKLMAKSFHAAVQARAIASEFKDESCEEIFIAALLYHLGEMTFFCTAKDSNHELYEKLCHDSKNPDKNQKELLGFTFHDLTVQLTQDWHLSELLHDAILNSDPKNTRTKHIRRGHALAFAATHGWSSAAVEKELVNISTHTGKPLKETIKFAHKNAELAISLAKEFGADAAAVLIPTVRDDSGADYTSSNSPQTSPYPITDPMLQLSILRELSSILITKPAINQILEMVLEGMYRGVGLDRTVFALVSPGKKDVRAKFVLGADSKEFYSRFVIPLQTKQNDLFKQMQLYKRSYWIQDTEDGEDANLVSADMRKAFATDSFFISPIVVKNSTIGYFYGDRQPSGRQLDQESFDSFKHFTQEAIIAIKFSQN